MAKFVQTNVGLVVHDLDLSVDPATGFNACSLSVGAEAVPANRYNASGDNAARMEPGLLTAQLEAQGYFDGAYDAKLFGSLSAQVQNDRGYAVTVLPQDRAIGSPAYLMRMVTGQYQPFGGGEVGGMLQWRLTAANKVLATADPARWGKPVVKGQLALDVLNSGAVNGTALNLGAVSATQRICATVHIFDAAGTVTVQIQSDDNGGMSSPTLRINTGAITPPFSLTLSQIGPFTDAWWRANISAGTTADVLVALGII